jgi:hypothetical protein
MRESENPAATIIERYYSAVVPESGCGRNNNGSLAIFAAILRASLTPSSVRCDIGAGVSDHLCRLGDFHQGGRIKKLSARV